MLSTMPMTTAWRGAAALALLMTAAVGQDASVSQRNVKIDEEVSLHVIETGKGDPIVFLHGVTGEASFWQRQLRAFASQGFRAIAYSRRYNYPNKNRRKPDHSAIVDAKDLAKLLTKLEIKKAHVVGFSYGAYSSLLFALEHPDRIKTLTLAEPPIAPWLESVPGKKAAAAKAHYKRLYTQLVEPARAAFAEGKGERALRMLFDVVVRKGAIDRMPAFVVARARRNLPELEAVLTSKTPYPDVSREAVQRLGVPVLLLSGSRTTGVAKFTDGELERLLPEKSSRRVILEDASHAMWVEQPVRCRQVLLRWIRESEAVKAKQALTPRASAPGPDDLDLHAMLEAVPGTVTRSKDGVVTIQSPSILRVRERHVWGGSVVRGKDGRYHMFVSVFRADAKSRGFSNEWLLSSEILHAVSDRPDRDYEFADVTLRGRRHSGAPEAWDAQSVHNPHVRRFGDRVYLYHIGSGDPGPQAPGSPGAALNDRNRIQQMQKIGVVSAKGVYELALATRSKKPLLEARTRVKADKVLDPSPPGTKALPDNMIVVNPSVVRRPKDGAYLLYFKGNLYDPRWRGVHGVAIGKSPSGPFRALDRFVFDVRMRDGRLASAEDPFVWHDAKRRRFYAIVKDFSGRMTGGKPALALLTSTDGLDWKPARNPLVSPKQLRFESGPVLAVRNLERPQLVFDEQGDPIALCCACIVGPAYKGPAFNVQIPLR